MEVEIESRRGGEDEESGKERSSGVRDEKVERRGRSEERGGRGTTRIRTDDDDTFTPLSPTRQHHHTTKPTPPTSFAPFRTASPFDSLKTRSIRRAHTSTIPTRRPRARRCRQMELEGSPSHSVPTFVRPILYRPSTSLAQSVPARRRRPRPPTPLFFFPSSSSSRSFALALEEEEGAQQKENSENPRRVPSPFRPPRPIALDLLSPSPSLGERLWDGRRVEKGRSEGAVFEVVEEERVSLLVLRLSFPLSRATSFRRRL